MLVAISSQDSVQMRDYELSNPEKRGIRRSDWFKYDKLQGGKK